MYACSVDPLVSMVRRVLRLRVVGTALRYTWELQIYEYFNSHGMKAVGDHRSLEVGAGTGTNKPSLWYEALHRASVKFSFAHSERQYDTSRKVAGSSPDEVNFFFSIDLILPAALWPWGRLSLSQKWVPERFLGGKARPARKADNLTAICEPIV
jgi:hypothetical protein